MRKVREVLEGEWTRASACLQQEYAWVHKHARGMVRGCAACVWLSHVALCFDRMAACAVYVVEGW